MIVSGFVEPITKELPLEYAVEMNRLIQLQMEGLGWLERRPLEAYASLPIPDTTEEHWRFTDLKGFDPDAFASKRTLPRDETSRRCSTWTSPGYATVTEDGIDISQAPEGVRFEPLPEDYERLYSLVGWDEKFAAHNAAMWKNGLLVVVPKGVVLEKPLYVRIAVTARRSGASSSSPRKARAPR